MKYSPLAVSVADLAEDFQRLAGHPGSPSPRHCRVLSCVLLPWRRHVRRWPPYRSPSTREPAVAGRIGGIKAEHAQRPCALLRRRAQAARSVAAEINGVSPRNTTSESSAPRAMALARRQHHVGGVPGRLALNERRGVGRIRLTSPRRPPLGSGPITTAKRVASPGAPPPPWGGATSTCASSDWPATGCRTLGIRGACECPRRPRARWSGWIEQIHPNPCSRRSWQVAGVVIKRFGPSPTRFVTRRYARDSSSGRISC